MIRSLLRSLIENLTVTHTDASAGASLRVDAYVMRAAELMPLEEVDVINLATGERFRTFVEAAAEGSGEVRLQGGERNPARKGDRIAVLAFSQLHEGQTLAHKAKCVAVDAANHVTAITEK
jgi:aspartate 1-decarboxylase